MQVPGQACPFLQGCGSLGLVEQAGVGDRDGGVVGQAGQERHLGLGRPGDAGREVGGDVPEDRSPVGHEYVHACLPVQRFQGFEERIELRVLGEQLPPVGEHNRAAGIQLVDVGHPGAGSRSRP